MNVPDQRPPAAERPVLVQRIGDLRALLDDARLGGGTVGLVPTMGAFHEGHRSLMRAARRAHDVVVVTLFVNPLQFGPSEDLDRYPADLSGDLAAAASEGVDIVFAPPVAEMYPGFPTPPATTVRVGGGLSEGLCGGSRPGHFDGVATVVTKLFSIAGPATAYFGRKDAQQLAVVRRLVADLCLPVEIVGCPLVREADGLAMSSRNRSLAPAERAAAAVIHRGLVTAAEMVLGGERDAGKLRRVVANVLTTEALVRLEYVEVVAAGTLGPLEELAGEVLVAVAARVGGVRLIDNMTIRIDADGAGVDLGVTVAPTGNSIDGGDLCGAR